MTRYFYTDPLAAAWMAKNFGMKFISKREGFDTEPGPVTYSFKHNDVSIKEVLYIHPDSVKLLKPETGDVVQFIDQTTRASHGYALALGEKIIQRNGIAFMWPEQEAQVK